MHASHASPIEQKMTAGDVDMLDCPPLTLPHGSETSRLNYLKEIANYTE